jgi:hypothetical protein
VKIPILRLLVILFSIFVISRVGESSLQKRKCKATQNYPGGSHISRYSASSGQLMRAVKLRKANEKYDSYEIQEKREERNAAMVGAVGATAAAGLYCVTRNPGGAMSAGTGAVVCAGKAVQAHRDIQIMEAHNHRVESNVYESRNQMNLAN